MTAAGPLTGIRIVDLTRLFPFSYGTQFLVDLGATVVKVEEPGGEVGRAFAGQYAISNRGKRSVTLDLRTSEGREHLIDLVSRSDVLIESFRSGFLESLGIGYDDLRRAQPTLVMCSISGYSKTGALHTSPGHDLNYFVLAGCAELNSGGAPKLPTIPVVDVAIGLHLTSCVSAALLGVARGGQACHVEISMAELALSLNTSTLGFESAEHPAVPFPEFVLLETPCYRVWRTRDDRWLALCNLEPKFWSTFLGIVERLDLLDDQFAIGDEGQRVNGDLEAIIASKTLAEWTDTFEGMEVCYSPVLTPVEAGQHPEFAMSGLVRSIGGSTEVLFPGKFNGIRPSRPESLETPGESNGGFFLERASNDAE